MQKLWPIFHVKINISVDFQICISVPLMGCTLCKAQYVRKTETAFCIRLNNHRKDVINPKSILAGWHFKKHRHSFNLHTKFTLIKQLSNIHTIDKETLKSRSKRREDF